MIIAFIIIGASFGLLAAVIAAILGASFWSIIGAYVIAGNLALVTSAAIWAFRNRRSSHDPSDRRPHRVAPESRYRRSGAPLVRLPRRGDTYGTESAREAYAAFMNQGRR